MASASFRMHIPASAVLVSTVLVAGAAPVGATPIISFVYGHTVRNAPNPLSIPDGDFLELGAGISSSSTPDPISSLSVQATQGLLTLPLNYNPRTAALFDPLFNRYIPLAEARPEIGWTITATDSTGTTDPTFTEGIANPVLLPFVTGITVSDSSTTPTVSWTLPDLTGFSVDEIRLRIIDASTEANLFESTPLPIATTSFMVPNGILTSGKSYVYRVILDQNFEWSSTFSGVTRVPEPGALVVVLAALASIGGARLLTRAGIRSNTSPASHAERARVSVTKSIRSALERISERHPELGAHLLATIGRGYLCAYLPDPRTPSDWET
jgi:hypothetical protein